MDVKKIYRDLAGSHFFRKVAETYLTRLGIMGLGFLISVVIARSLGPNGCGLYWVAMSVSTIGIQFGNLGLHSSNVYYVSRNPKLLPGLFANSLLVAFLAGGLGSLLAWALFGLWPSLAPLEGNLLSLSLLWIPFGLAYLLVQSLLVGLQDMRSYNKIELASKILNFLFIGLLIALHSVSVEWFYGAGIAILAVGTAWIGARFSKELARGFQPSLKLFREGLHFGVKAYLSAFFAFIVLRIDMLMVKDMLGADQAGYYGVGVRIADAIAILPTIIGTLLFPKLSAVKSEAKKWELLKKVLGYVAAFMVVLTAALMLLSQPLISLLFGKVFLPAVPAFVWLLPGVLMVSLNSILMNYFASSGMPWVTVYSPAFAALLNILSNLVLIPRYGIVGASLSSVLAYGCMLLTSILYLYARRRGTTRGPG